MKSKNHKRSFFSKTYLINPSFQYRFMGYLVLTIVFSMTIIFASNLYFFDSFIAKGEALNLPKDHPFFLIIQDQKDFMMNIFIYVSTIISAAIGIWGLFFSHRIAGPLFRLNKTFKDAAETGKPIRKVTFRKADFFQEIPTSINSYFEGIESSDKVKELPEIPISDLHHEGKAS